MRRALALAAAAGLLSGCFELDPFLYTPDRTDHYVFDPNGSVPEETVTTDRIEPLTIVANDQISLGAVRVHPAGTPVAHLIFFHGKGGTLDTNFWRAKRLSNMGFDVLAFDYRGWGTSTDVTPTEPGIDEDTHAVYLWFVGQLPANTPIYFYGQSFGTATATQRAVSDPPKAMILESGFASIEEFERDSAQLAIPPDFIAASTWATTTRISQVHVPLLIIHGLADDYVRPEFSQLLFDRANDPKQLVLVPGAHHSDIPQTMGADYVNLLRTFIESH